MRLREGFAKLAQRFTSEKPQVERQELWCHDCENYVQFDVDLSLNGNHVLECPKCGHEHCRVVKDGVISDIRWDSRNGPTIWATNANWSNTSNYTSYSASSLGAGGGSTANVFLYQAWTNSTTY